MGSRLGTHALWTIALSVVITLLALAPMVLPGDRPLDALPAPLRGSAQAGEVIADALAPSSEDTNEATPDSPQSPLATPASDSGGVLGDTASGSAGGGSSGGGPDRSGGGSTPNRPGGEPEPPPPPPEPEPEPPKPPKPPRESP